MEERTRPAEEALGDGGVLFEDNHLLALDKPAGLLTQAARKGDDNLVDRARAYLRLRYDKPGNVFVGLVHRLDRNVSGVVLLARTSKAAGRLTRAFQRREVDKRYIGVAEGEVPESGRLVDRIGRAGGRRVVRRPDGKEALLTFRRLGVHGGRSLIEVTLLTGRKHQIRAQLAMHGHPLVGDPLYGRRSPAIGRPALHAAALALEHPVRRTPLSLHAPIPDDLARLVTPFGVGNPRPAI
ncbi:MAG: RluA family pseudouridine synthase [Myxococcota bacterium]